MDDADIAATADDGGDDEDDDLFDGPMDDDVDQGNNIEKVQRNFEKFFHLFQEQRAVGNPKFTDTFLDNLRNSGFYRNSMTGLIEDTDRIQNQRTMPKAWQKLIKRPRLCIFISHHRFKKSAPIAKFCSRVLILYDIDKFRTDVVVLFSICR